MAKSGPEQALAELRRRWDKARATGTLTDSRLGEQVKITLQLNGTPEQILEQLERLSLTGYRRA